jgi:predicted DNA-binding transcriptional regulator YafY
MKATRMSGSKWEAVRRCLAILRRLQQGPSNRTTLMQAVREALPDAYRTGTSDVQRKCFERDLENLRYQLGATVDWDPEASVYRLVDVGPLGCLDLSDKALRGLALLLDTFGPESGVSEIVRPLLNETLSALPLDRRRHLERTSSALYLDLRRLDTGEIVSIVWEKVHRAVTQRQILRFQYLSPQYEQSIARMHTVEPYLLRFHWGHYELRAYCRHWSNLQGQERYEVGWLRYRLDRILAEGIEIFPEKLPPGQRRRRMIGIRYRISPKLVAGGVSRHFEEMTVGEPDAKGWMEVTGKTDDLFEAQRVFLAYGEHCVVLEPLDLRRKMKRVVQEMTKLYENSSDL